MKESRQGFCRREEKVVPCRGAEDRKGLGINSGKSIMRNPETETESMRRRAESTGGSVNLNTVTEIRRSSDMIYLLQTEQCLPCTEFCGGL